VLPGENGIKGLLRQYGEQLVCVRYRYDKTRHKRYKTVDLIIDEKNRIPETLSPATRRVYFKIGYGETELRELVKRAGGYWNSGKEAWHLEYLTVIQLGLERQIIDPDTLVTLRMSLFGDLSYGGIYEVRIIDFSYDSDEPPSLPYRFKMPEQK
jgi:hypothetical protein